MAGDKFMLGIDFSQPRSKQEACGLSARNTDLIQKFKEKRDSNYISQD